MLVEPYTCDIVSGASRRFEQLRYELERLGYNVRSLYIPLWCKRYLTNKGLNIVVRVVVSIYVDVRCAEFILRKRGACISDLNPSFLALFTKKMVIQVHDIRWHELDMLRHPRILHGISGWFIRNYARMLTVSGTMGESLYRLRKGKSTFVHYNSVSVQLIRASEDINESDCISWAEENGICIDKPTFTYVARIEERKAQIELIEAACGLNTGCNLILVGSQIGTGYMRSVQDVIDKCDPRRLNVRHFERLDDRSLGCAYLVSSMYISTSI